MLAPPMTVPTSLRPAPASTDDGSWIAARPRLARGALVMTVICSLIALFLVLIDGGSHVGAKFIYSFAIGFSCWLLSDVLRVLLLSGLQRVARARGLTIDVNSRRLGWPLALPIMLMAFAVGPILGLALGDALTGFSSPGLSQLGSPQTRLTLAVTLAGMVAATLFIGLKERLTRLRERAEVVQREATEQQLKMLQTQLEPHMLFNTLANLRVLIGTDPPRAIEMLDRLNAFLRSTLSASRSGLHPLADEFDRLRDYLALMSFRMDRRLQVVLDLPPELGTVAVPPLLLQPLVENAIRHGLEPKVEGGRIEVSARREGALLRLTVRDTGVGLGASPLVDGSKFGVGQVRSRLQTMYGEQARFTLAACDDAEGGTCATLDLPLPAAAASVPR